MRVEFKEISENINNGFDHVYSYQSLFFLLFLYLSIAILASWGVIGVCYLYSIENSPYPEVNPQSYIAYPSIYLRGTSALMQKMSPLV